MLVAAVIGLAVALQTAIDLGERLRQRLDAATERLLYAAKDGYLVPPADAVASPPPAAHNEAADPLPEQLRELIDRWDRPETRQLEEERVRMKLSQGYSPLAILKDYEG